VRTLAISDGPLAKHLWNLQRFGLTPTKVLHRIIPGASPRVVCVSMPKAGTHLLERAVCLHPRLYRKLMPTVTPPKIALWGGLEGVLGALRPGQVVVAHLPSEFEASAETLRRHGITSLFIIRDPRDMVLSETHFVMSRKDHPLHSTFAALPDDRARIRMAIEGPPVPRFPSIGRRLQTYAGWLEAADAVVRFEELVGQAGGGTTEKQLDALLRVFTALGLDVGIGLLEQLAGRLFSSSSPTFRRGAIGHWRDVFDEELEDTFNRVVGSDLARYGYGSEADW
jgi:hypothetical protein